MGFIYSKALTKIASGTINFANGGTDLRLLLVKVAGSTTTDTERDVEFLAGFSALGEISATNYVRKALTEALVEDLANDRAEFTPSNVTWTALGGAANTDRKRECQSRAVSRDGGDCRRTTEPGRVAAGRPPTRRHGPCAALASGGRLAAHPTIPPPGGALTFLTVVTGPAKLATQAPFLFSLRYESYPRALYPLPSRSYGTDRTRFPCLSSADRGLL